MAYLDPTLSMQVLVRLGKDAEMRHTQGGKAVTNVSGAHNKKYKSNGEEREITTWIQFSFWGDAQAELSARLLKKGCLVLFNGRPGVNSYTNNADEVQSSLTMDVADFKIVAYPEGYVMGVSAGETIQDEDIPF